MKFYSELTKKTYDTSKECLAAEKQYQEEQARLKEEREARDASIAAAKEKMLQARQEYLNAMKKYEEVMGWTSESIFDWIFKN